MAQNIQITDIVENTRQEILFAIKERIAVLTRSTNAPVQLKKVVIRDTICSHHDSLRYFEIKNVFVDEGGSLCGDLAGKDDRFSDGILFGKIIEDLTIGDLKMILDALYGDDCTIDLTDYNINMIDRREGIYGFLMGKKAGISR